MIRIVLLLSITPAIAANIKGVHRIVGGGS
jgi:hypothetical protein